MRSARGAENPLSRDFDAGSLLKFALPTILAMVFMGLYTAVDAAFVARFAEANALPALNIVCPAVNLIVGLGTMLATGGSAIIARRMGAGDVAGASRDFTLITAAGALLGALIAALGSAFIDPIVRGFGASDALFPHCKAYLSILLGFAPASLLQVLFQNLMVTAGRPGTGMLLGAGAGVVNLLLDWVFMGPLRMGIRGAALGTGIGYMIPAALGAQFFRAGRGSLRFCRPVLRLGVLAESCANGFSEMLGQAAAAVTTFLFNRVMLRLLGERGVAAITIMIYAQFLMTSLYLGFSMGVAPVISYNYGRRDWRRLNGVFSICARLIAIASAAVTGVALAFDGALVRAFAEAGTPVYAIAREGFFLSSFAFLFCGFNIFASAALTALSDGRRSAIVSLLRTLVWIAVLLRVLPEYLGATGVWLVTPVAELLTLLAALPLLHRSRRELRRA